MVEVYLIDFCGVPSKREFNDGEVLQSEEYLSRSRQPCGVQPLAGSSGKGLHTLKPRPENVEMSSTPLLFENIAK